MLVNLIKIKDKDLVYLKNMDVEHILVILFKINQIN